MRQSVALPLLAACLLVAGPVHAAEPAPEIPRAVAAPQAVGVVHSLRQIPEACARLEGAFTGDTAHPYRYAPVRTSPQCQPRARFVDAAKVNPSTSNGWLLNDLIRVPNAACTSQQAVVRVWRKPVEKAAPKLDAQGKARIYLQDSKQQAQSGQVAPVTMFAAQMAVEGRCD